MWGIRHIRFGGALSLTEKHLSIRSFTILGKGEGPPTIKKNSVVIKHFEEYYFDKMWKAARLFTNGVYK
jgi:hypothetical protein